MSDLDPLLCKLVEAAKAEGHTGLFVEDGTQVVEGPMPAPVVDDATNGLVITIFWRRNSFGLPIKRISVKRTTPPFTSRNEHIFFGTKRKREGDINEQHKSFIRDYIAARRERGLKPGLDEKWLQREEFYTL